MTGLVHADLIYEYRKTGVQQVVLLSESPPDPEEFGLLAEATRLEVLTEFFEAPTPTRQPRVLERVDDPTLREAMAEPDWLDESLDFGPFRMDEGRALSLGAWLDGTEMFEAVPIGKRWTVDPESGRTILFESADYWSLAAELSQLPASDGRPRRVREARATAGRAATLGSARPTFQAKRDRRIGARIPARSVAAAAANPTPARAPGTDPLEAPPPSLRLASASALDRPSGLVLDWTTLNSGQNNYVFQGDTTYYISGTVTLTGTNILEGGAVLKYTNAPGATVKLQTSGAALQCQTAPCRPAVFTSKDDNTVGEIIPGSTGSPGVLTNIAALSFWSFYGAAPANLQHLRVAYAQEGVQLFGESGHLIRHTQFVQCHTALRLGMWFTSLTLRNVLVHAATNIFLNAEYCTARGEHVTFHQAAYLCGAPAIPVSLSLANSLVVAVNNVTGFTSTNSVTLASASGVFQTVGAGAHYLAPGSPHRNAGTTNLNAELADELEQLTTYPPVVLSNVTLNAPTTWGPQAARDTDRPDLGYHYVPMDYALNNVAVGVGGTLTVLPGTALGAFGCDGLITEDYGKVVLLGTPRQPVRLAPYGATQELSLAWGCTNWGPQLLIGPAHDLVPGSESGEISARFAEFALLGGRGVGIGLANGWFVVKRCVAEDCQFSGGVNQFAGSFQRESWVELRNNLFLRTANRSYGWVHLSAHNNLFWGGTNYLNSGFTGNYPWYFHDNAFHGNGINPNLYGEYANLTRSHSGYLGPGQATLNGLTTGDIALAGFPYSAGPLGTFYHSITNLINVGSRSRELAGLYHFTVKPGLETKEGADSPDTVDIGFHYVGVNASNQPLDFDLDGLPDWYEDRNGDNLLNSGETARNSPTDAGLRVWITRPAGGSPIP